MPKSRQKLLGLAACAALLATLGGAPVSNPVAGSRVAPTTLPANDASAALIGPEIHVANLKNVHRLLPGMYCGSAPESVDDLKALASMGVRTIISVDGMHPDVADAAKLGLRYVHLPFGYDGIPRDRELEIARAVRDLPGPVYVHCHHGLHRAPAAAVVVAETLGGWSPSQAVAALHRLGTSPHYQGLYAAAMDFTPPTKEELDKADHSFPSVAKLDDLADTMVEIDHHWDNLKVARKAGWTTPADHPDITPAHEALLLKELLREAHRPGGAADGRDPDLLERLAKAEQQASEFENDLRAGDRAVAEKADAALENSCASCHDRYRDPQGSRRMLKTSPDRVR